MPREEQKFKDDYEQYLSGPVKNNQTIEPGSFEAARLLELMDTDYGKEKLGFEAYEKAAGGDFSSFEKAAPALRNYAASKYMKDIEQSHPGLLEHSLEDPRLQQLLEDNSMNPAFRLGCSLRAHTKGYNSQAYTQFDDYMNSHIMQQTLRPLDDAQSRSIREMYPNEEDYSAAVSQNIEKQVMVARTLLLAHIGNAALEEAPGRKNTLNRSAASMAAHCSRTAYVFKPGADKDVSQLMDSLTGKGLGDAAGMHRRGAATHSVKNGKTIGDFREEKVKLGLFNQHGMDVAIGGLGNPGIPGPNGRRQTLKNDGSCGHMYLRADAGDKNTCTSLLIGFESDSPSAKHNQQGHEHTLAAKPEYMSSFLGQRTDEMGSKYGGRVVDCTSYDLKELAENVNDFSNYYRAMLIEGMHNPQARRQIEQANVCLCGVPMDSSTLSHTLTDIGMPPQKAAAITSAGMKARGIPARCPVPEASPVKVAPISETPKPGRWTRLKAALGSNHAKESIQQFQAHCRETGAKAAKAQPGPAPDEFSRTGKFFSITQKLNTFGLFRADRTRENTQHLTVGDLAGKEAQMQPSNPLRKAAREKMDQQRKSQKDLDPIQTRPKQAGLSKR